MGSHRLKADIIRLKDEAYWLSGEPTIAKVERTWSPGLKVLNPLSLAERDARTGSIEEKMVPQSPLQRRNSVMEARMRTVLSALTAFREASRLDIRVQSMISAVFIASRDAILRPVIFRRTFASPIMVYILESDIAAARNDVDRMKRG